jgi:hypothetical protein
MLRKEWQEQRWRFLLGTVVLSGLLAGMLRAQVVPIHEAALLIYWPVGILMVIFLAMGPVAAERADRTWEFLVSQPVSRAEILVAKWRMGLIQLLGMMAIATTAGLLALWSRGFYGQTTLHDGRSLSTARHDEFYAEAAIEWAVTHPAIWLCALAATATISMACLYTPLFLLLTRARSEFTAALGGIMLTIVVHAWLIQFGVFVYEVGRVGLSSALSPFVTAALNPLSPLLLAVAPAKSVWWPWSVLVHLAIHIALWIVLPVWIVRHKLQGAAVK